VVGGGRCASMPAGVQWPGGPVGGGLPGLQYRGLEVWWDGEWGAVWWVCGAGQCARGQRPSGPVISGLVCLWGRGPVGLQGGGRPGGLVDGGLMGMVACLLLQCIVVWRSLP
jgi:hypothetical protein